MSPPLLTIAGLSKRFANAGQETNLFLDFALTVQAGETIALTGPSGSGKSTLLNMIAGVVAADAGSITLAPRGGEMDGAPPVLCYGQIPAAATTVLRRRHIGYVFQFFNLVPTLTVRENILLSLRLAGRMALLPEALVRVQALGLTHRLDAFPESLSGGEQQRAAIARALAPQPELILADEPTGNLDAANAEQVVTTLWQAVAAAGSALLVATHDPRVAARAQRRLDLAC